MIPRRQHRAQGLGGRARRPAGEKQAGRLRVRPAPHGCSARALARMCGRAGTWRLGPRLPWLGSVRTGQAPGAQSPGEWGAEHGARVLGGTGRTGHQKAGRGSPGPAGPSVPQTEPGRWDQGTGQPPGHPTGHESEEKRREVGTRGLPGGPGPWAWLTCVEHVNRVLGRLRGVEAGGAPPTA